MSYSRKTRYLALILLGAGAAIALGTGLLPGLRMPGFVSTQELLLYGSPIAWRGWYSGPYFGTPYADWVWLLFDSLFFAAAAYLGVLAYRIKRWGTEIAHPGLFMLTFLYAGLTIAFTLLFYL